MSNPYILVEDFRAGLDTRRMRTTSPSGTLRELNNGQITRGGEVEKAQAFRKVLDAEAGKTFGLLETPDGFFVFGSADLTGTYTNNVLSSNPPIRYQRLTVSSGAAMEEVVDAKLFDGKPYVIAKYDSGSIHHFFDGTEVTDWFSGKARAKFAITGGEANAATAATGSLDISDGFIGDEVTQITVNSTNLMSSAVTFTSGDTAQTVISNVVDNINAYSLTSGYSASWSGETITITALIEGSSENGNAIAATVTGDFTVSNINNMSGGSDASEISDITVAGSSIIDTSIVWAGSISQTARATASAIRNYSSTSGYTAEAFGREVFIASTTDGTGPNGDAVVITKTGSITISPSSGITMKNGSTTSTSLKPGRFAKTINSKMYVLSGSVMYYSAIDDPSDFTTGTGHGFDNLSASENLVGIANYFENIGIFSRSSVHIFFVDPDPAKNVQLQILNNTGSIAPHSIIEFGDNDVFYLSESGVRSLRARDSSNAAFVNDVGVSVDSLVQTAIRKDEPAARKAAGILEPRDSRYMLSIGETIYVFSFFPTSKVSAWSTLSPGFQVDHWAYSGQIVLCRSGDSIYRFGGQVDNIYDSSEMTMTLPFLSAGDPAADKTWTSIDVACEGTFEISIALDPLNPDEYETMAIIKNTTYKNSRVPIRGVSSHISVKMVSKNDGYARIGNISLHHRKGHSQ